MQTATTARILTLLPAHRFDIFNINHFYHQPFLPSTKSGKEGTTMIGYVTLGTNNLEKAAVFYDALLAELGAGRFMEMENMIAWSAGPGTPGVGLIKPNNGDPATVWATA